MTGFCFLLAAVTLAELIWLTKLSNEFEILQRRISDVEDYLRGEFYSDR